MANSKFSRNPSAIEFGGDNLSESIIVNSVNVNTQPKQIQLQHLPVVNVNSGKTGDIKSAINLLQVPSNSNQVIPTNPLNMPLLSTLPDPTPIIIPNNIHNTNNSINMNEQHFNLKVNYNGQVHKSNQIVIPDLKILETKLQNLDKLNDTELEEGT